MAGIGPTELIIVLVIVLIFFGVGRLGEVGGALGKGIREFRKASQGAYDDSSTDTNSDTSSDGQKSD